MRTALIPLFSAFILLFCAAGCKKDSADDSAKENIPLLDYTLLKTYPHDTNSYTEGLLIARDTMFESTGFPQGMTQGRSVFGSVDPVTGKINVKADPGKQGYFGEGIAFLDGKFYQLTYRDGVGFVYDAVTYETIGAFSIPGGEGWGLTTDGKDLIMSNGTNALTYIDPATFRVTRVIYVTEMGLPTTRLNELEFIKGYIYSNIWLEKKVVKIDPSDGRVIATIDLTTLADTTVKIFPGSLSMNGIAFDPGNDHIFITGKLWPVIFEIEMKDLSR